MTRWAAARIRFVFHVHARNGHVRRFARREPYKLNSHVQQFKITAARTYLNNGDYYKMCYGQGRIDTGTMRSESARLPDLELQTFRGDRAVPDGVSNKEVKRRLRVKLTRKTMWVVPDVSDVWLEQRIRTLGATWIAAYRMVSAEGRITVGEIRIFPEEDLCDRPRGEWVSGTLKGSGAAVPLYGVTTKIVREVKPHLWLKYAARIVNALKRHLPLVTSASVRDFPQAPVADAARTEPRFAGTSRGRRPLSDEFYVRVACEYVEALAAGLSPVKSIVDKYKAPAWRVSGWVHRARVRGFLEGKVVQGKASGALSTKARLIRDRMMQDDRRQVAKAHRQRRHASSLRREAGGNG